MTTDHIDVETLSAFVDGELNAVNAKRVERHVADCDTCGHSLERVRALVVAARALPREIAPPPEVLAGIRRRVPSSASVIPKRWWQNVWVAAAAGIVILAFGITQMVRSAIDSKARMQTMRAQKAAVSVVLTSVDRNYAPTLDELRATLESQRSRLAPSTVRKLDHSIAVIDSAIAEARTALEADPASAVLSEMLSGYYERKVEFLKRANSLPSSL